MKTFSTTFLVLLALLILSCKVNAQFSQGWAAVYDNSAAGLVMNESGRDIKSDASGNTYTAVYTSGDMALVKYDLIGTRLWVATYNGTGNGADTPYEIAIDPSGNIYVAGSTTNASGNSDIALWKYTSSGNLVWVKTYDGINHGSDQASGIFVSSTGNYITVTGNTNIAVGDNDIITIQWDASGNQQWYATLGGTQNLPDLGYDVIGDASGNIYTVGNIKNTPGQYTGRVIKYNSLGAQQWASSFTGGLGYGDEAVSVALDPSENIIVVGSVGNSGSSVDIATAKYTPAGVQSWMKTITSMYINNDYGKDVLVDGDGNVYNLGYTSDGSTNYINLQKYDPLGNSLWGGTYVSGATPIEMEFDLFGNIIFAGKYSSGNQDVLVESITPVTHLMNWQKTFSGTPASYYDYVMGLCVDGSGNTHICGQSFNGSSTIQDATTATWDNSGNFWWSDFYGLPFSSSADVAADIVMDANFNVYVTGYSYNNSTTNEDYVTLKYNSSGAQQWATLANGTGNSYDHGKAIAVDASGNVYVTGYMTNSYKDYATIKYNSAGAQQWKMTYSGTLSNSIDSATAIYVDASLNVYVTGMASNTTSNGDIVTIKYNSAGVQQWVKAYNGTANNNDIGRAVYADATGNVYVCGSVQNTGFNNDFAVIKYDAAGNQLWAKNYNGTGNLNDYGVAMAVDASGNSYITGYAYNLGAVNDITTVKYDTDGNLIWSKSYNGTANSNDYGTSVTLDAAGNVLVCGSAINTGASEDYITIKYDAAGNQLWVKVYNGPGNGTDKAVSVKTDLSNRVYTTGYVLAQAQTLYNNYTTVVYDNAGTAVDTLVYAPGYYATCSAVYPDGGVVVSGNSLVNSWKDIHTEVNGSAPVASAGSNVSICAGGNTQLNATGGVSYIWSPATGLSSTTISNPVASPTTTTTYTVTVTNAQGCTATSTVTVTVTTSITVTASATNTNICAGVSTNLNASGATNYTWNPGSLSGASVSVTPLTTTTFTVTGTDGGGCSNTATVTINVTALPNVNAGTDQTICAGSAVTLSGSGATSYTWNNGVTNGVPFSPASTTTYTVTGTTGSCSNTDQVVVTVNPLPNVNAGTDQAVCAGTSVTLSGSGATSYTWNNGVSNGVPFTPASTTTYTVTGTTGSCSNTDQVLVTVNPIPNVNAGTDQVVCAGSSVTLSGSGATSYTWNNGVINNTPFYPSVGTVTYTVTGTTGSCSNTDQVVVTVNALPNVNAGTDQVICSGTAVTLSGSGATGYTWDHGVLNNTPFTPPAGTVTYTVTGTTGSCSNTDQVTITVNATPSAPVASSNSPVPLNGTLELYANFISGATYAWTGPNSFTSTSQYPVIPNATPTLNGTYSVNVTVNGCQSPSSNTTVTVLNQLPDVTISGNTQSETGQNITGVKVKITGDVTDSVTTTSSGAYSFTMTQGSNCVITPTKNNDVQNYNGISALDIVLMQRHILNVQLLGTPYKIIAADVNCSQSVTTLDIVLTKSLILQNTTSFPGNKLWSFVNSDFTFSVPTNPFPFEQSRTYSNAASSATNQHFVGVKLGDVNNSWDPGIPKQNSPNTIEFNINDKKVSQGEIISVPVLANSFNKISGMQYTIEWDPSVLTFEGIGNGAISPDFGLNYTGKGKLTVLWYTESLDGKTLTDNTTLFFIKMKATGKNGSSSIMAVNGSVTEEEVVDNDLNIVKISGKDGLIMVGDETSAPSLGQNIPNPFNSGTAIEFYLPAEAEATITICDIYGRKIFEYRNIYPTGNSVFEWDGKDHQGNEMSQGTYLYYLKTSDFTGVKKMMKVK